MFTGIKKTLRKIIALAVLFILFAFGVKFFQEFLTFRKIIHNLKAKYFTFNGNLIQFQTLVVRFNDKYIEEGHRMKGKSIYLFMKAFVLDGKNTQEFLITSTEDVPDGYRVGDPPSTFEKEVWKKFWKYALDP